MSEEKRPSKPVKEDPIEPAKKRKTPGAKYTPNITPLLDVLFLLLLFFVLASKFRQDEGMIPGSLPPPDQPSSGVPPTPPTILEVRGDGEDSDRAIFSFQGESEGIIDSNEIFRQLQARFNAMGNPVQAAEDGIVIIKYYDARWQFIVDAYNQAARAGFKKISFQQG